MFLLKDSKKGLIWCAMLALAVSFMSGCVVSQSTTGVPKTFKVTTSDKYPLETDVELSYWLALPTGVAAYSNSMNNILLKEHLEEKTGVGIRFVHPPIGQTAEAFGLMIASGDLPDIIEYGWLTYPGGPEKAINEGIITSLNEYIDTISPNFEKVLAERPDIDRQVKTEEGSYFSYPFLTNGGIQATSMGFIIRQDLLDKAGLQAPVTLEEWDTVLRAFKSMGVEVPLSLRLDGYNLKEVSPFTGLFSVYSDYYVEDGVVKYGPYEKNYEAWVRQMSKWYKDGLLDNDFASIDSTRLTSLVVNGQVGSTYCYAGSELGMWLPVIKEKNSEFIYRPIQYPSVSRSAKPMIGQKKLSILNICSAISAKCENKEVAVRFLDYGYSEEGGMLYNFGKEGVSYVMNDGEPVYTDAIMDVNSNGGLSIGQAMSKYIRGSYYGPFVQDLRYVLQYMQEKTQKDALYLWSDTEMDKYLLPFLTLSEADNKQYSKIMQDADTYKQEKLFKFISGTEDLGSFPNYYSELKNMGIEDAIALRQKAYDAYLANK
ncbi:MAG: extracellular solute-binding protein [Firmicutes bacterium]|nr:extracellular solute-binding protein [Bacillota bacterium]